MAFLALEKGKGRLLNSKHIGLGKKRETLIELN